MEEFYIDLSDKIFIHKDFVEVIGLKIPKGKGLVEWFEQDVFDDIDEVVIFQISTWEGVKLEYTVIVLEKLRVLLESKGNIVGLEYC